MTELKKILKRLRKDWREVATTDLICQVNLETILQKIEKESGWALFKFFSSYGGDDKKENDIEVYYLFAPHVAKEVEKKFKNAKFSHGDPGNEDWENPDYREFSSFLSNLRWEWISYRKVMSPDKFDVDLIECDKKQFCFLKEKGVPVINE